MICNGCFSYFEIKIKAGPGGNNRLLCYECLPVGLSKLQRGETRRKAYLKRAALEKKKKGCFYCNFNKYASALEWHHMHDNKEKESADLIKISWKAYETETNHTTLILKSVIVIRRMNGNTNKA